MVENIKKENIGKLFSLPVEERKKAFLSSIQKVEIDEETAERRNKILMEMRGVRG